MPASLLALPQAVAISGFVGPEPYKRHVGGGGGQASRVYPLRALHVPAESACSAVQGIFDIDDIDEVRWWCVDVCTAHARFRVGDPSMHVPLLSGTPPARTPRAVL